MSNARKSTLYIYCKTPAGWRYLRPAYNDKGKIVPQTAMVREAGAPKLEAHPEGKYYLSLGGKWVPAGDNAKQAVQQLAAMTAQLRGDKPPALVEAASGKLAEAQKTYLDHIDLQVRAKKLKPRTLVNARSITNEFLSWLAENTKHTLVGQVTTKDVDGYVAWAISSSPTESVRTGANKYIRVGQFLKFVGHAITVNKNAPKYEKDGPVRMYSTTELTTFFAACDPVQALTYRTFLKTGLRETELVYLERSDINAETGELLIRSKPKYGWTPKTHECRAVQIDDELLAELLAHLETHPHKLVFPTKSGEPNLKLLRTLKRICKRGELPEEEWWLHAFRSTCATNWLRDGLGVPEVQRLLGHRAGSKSIWRYLAAIQGEELRTKINAIHLARKLPA